MSDTQTRPTLRRRLLEVGAVVFLLAMVFGLCGLISTADPQPPAAPAADGYLQCAYYSHTLDVAPPGPTWESDDTAEQIVTKVLRTTGEADTVRRMRYAQAFADDNREIYTWTDLDGTVQAVARLVRLPGQGLFLDSFSVCDSGEGAAGMQAIPACPDNTGTAGVAGVQCSVEDIPAYGSGRPPRD